MPTTMKDGVYILFINFNSLWFFFPFRIVRIVSVLQFATQKAAVIGCLMHVGM